MGSPASSKPHGTEMPHTPAMLAGSVSMSAAYIWSGLPVRSPRRKAVVGETGAASTSTCWNTASKSCLSSVRTFCA